MTFPIRWQGLVGWGVGRYGVDLLTVHAIAGGVAALSAAQTAVVEGAKAAGMRCASDRCR